MAFDIWHVAIPVKDLDKSVDFYCGTLGFVLIGRDDIASKKQAFVAVRKGGFSLELFQPTAFVESPRMPDHLAFECEDLQQFRTTLAGRGLDTSKVAEYDNGVQQLRLSDPDGVTLDFFQGRKLYEDMIS